MSSSLCFLERHIELPQRESHDVNERSTREVSLSMQEEVSSAFLAECLPLLYIIFTCVYTMSRL